MNRLSTTILLLLSFLMLLFSIGGDRGLFALDKVQKEVKALKEKNTELAEEAAKLRGEIAKVETSRYTLEEKARTELGLAKPNEVIYLFPESKTK